MMVLNESGIQQIDSNATHWLVGIQGETIQQPTGYYHWKVSIYPSNYEGAFNWNHPFYCSDLMQSMDCAIDLAKTFIVFCENDELSSSTIKEKIS
ncbi:hypothetical protein [Bacillus sp. UNC438CL73TsuS30]|uniref:hypothetical protein n=1 Tax=Bacillus sp. UNC438CL73TsuS30 TaxID=1340434 RepID=UPI000689C92A|nr:hypothetical protein [Bacillus sp. UNC438CL73TsuS30]